MNKMHMVRVWLTEDCNALCQFCMNSSSRGKDRMSLEKFELICSYFHDNGFDKIAIMGGEPTIHPQFGEMMFAAQKYFECVYLFTNAIQSNRLLSYHPREKDSIIYNFHFAKHINEKSLLLDESGERLLDVIVDYNSPIEEMLTDILTINKIASNRTRVQLVLNNSSNIFKHKEIIVSNINSLYERLKNNGVKVSFECAAPLCFTFGTNLPEHNHNTICPQEAVLIDGSYNVRFCNLYSSKLVNLFTGASQDTIIPFQILRNYVTMESFRNKSLCLDKICKDCLYYGTVCNGKCHIGQEIISREDIVEHTLIPWLK